MRILKIAVFLFFAVWLVLPMVRTSIASGQSGTSPGSIDSDPAPGLLPRCIQGQNGPAEAATGFDDQSIDPLFVSNFTHHQDQLTFDAVDFITDGLGPVYNAQSCRECHQNTVSGGISQTNELRAGIKTSDPNTTLDPTVVIKDDAGNPHFINKRSLINDRAICPAGKLLFTQLPNGSFFDHKDAQAQERVDNIVDDDHKPVSPDQIVTTFRTSLNLLGDGLVEAVNSNDFQTIANNQPASMRGTLIPVKLLEVPGDPVFRIGRFGWKNQQASLLSFSSDAYLNEMGITNRFDPDGLGKGIDVTDVCDEVPQPDHNDIEDEENDIDSFTRFMRATKAPSRAPHCESCPDPDPQIKLGSDLFVTMQCAVCHVKTLFTQPVGTWINGNTFQIPNGLGCRQFHPFGDFLLHDLGTVDVTQGLAPANRVRTPPLWGVRTRDRLMHDGASLSFLDAIRRHHNQAQASFNAFFDPTRPDSDRAAVIAFLKSL
jgi:CxxC motif-containing protein (DUF1111 family)